MNRSYLSSFSSVTLVPKRFALSWILCASLLVFVVPSVAGASTIFDNFGPGLTYDINSGNTVGNAFDGNDYAEGNTFTSPLSGIFQSLRIALSCAFSCPDLFSVFLTTDAGNQPGAVLENFSVAGGVLGPIGTNNAPLVLNSVVLPQLIVGHQYWVAVAGPLTDTISWNLNTTGDVSDQAISSDNAATWFAPSGNTPGALQVNAAATVPEPGSSALLIGGGLLLSVIRRRRRSPKPFREK
jgi:hypothetical protein